MSDALGGEPRWRARGATRRLLRRAKHAIGDDPIFLPLLLRVTPEGTARALGPATQLVVEGFPRSGNTFAVFALRHANPELRIASHVHHPAQVKSAVRRGLPTVLLVREPLDALASNMISSPHAGAGLVLREYIRYHRELVPALAGVAVATFDEVTGDSVAMTGRVNARFGTALRPFSHGAEDQASVFEAIDRHYLALYRGRWLERLVPRPVPERAAEKLVAIERLTAPGLAPLLDQARDLFLRFSATRSTIHVP